MKILATYAAYTVAALPSDHNIALDVDKGYCRTASTVIRIATFKNGGAAKYLRGFTIGAGRDGKVFANALATSMTSHARAHEIHYGAALGDTIRVDGVEYIVKKAPNDNIELEAK